MPTIPFSGSLDMSKGTLDYTCAGSSATLPDRDLEVTKA